ncbi:MAG: hypothetical protein DME46_03860 [Verrucomicrobia bacterium]|nr:MAG: hypothetical protein DME46_03860 [Verrucomicrobiota bacterium]
MSTAAGYLCLFCRSFYRLGNFEIKICLELVSDFFRFANSRKLWLMLSIAIGGHEHEHENEQEQK